MGSISLNGINKSFGTTEVLKDINLDIKDGEFYPVGSFEALKETLSHDLRQ